MAEMQFKIDGIPVDPPQNLDTLEIELSFDNASPMANITGDALVFGNKAAKLLIALAYGGDPNVSTPGFFSAPDFQMSVVDGSTTFDLPPAIIDFKDDFRKIHATKVSCNFKLKRSLDRLEVRTAGITWKPLIDEGIITSADYVDIDYLIEEVFDELKTAILIAMIYLISVQIIEIIKDTATEVATQIATGLLGIPLAIAQLIINALYFSLLIIELISLVEQLLPQIFPPAKTFLGMSWRRMLEKIAEKLGYTFESSLALLDDTYNLPTKERKNQVASTFLPYPGDTGIPRIGDPNYIASNFMGSVATRFEGRYLLDGTVLHFEPLLNDAFWVQPSGQELQPVLLEDPEFLVNADEMVARRIWKYQKDSEDQWTTEESLGSSWEVVVSKPGDPNPENSLLDGIKEEESMYALGARKNQFTALEFLALQFLTAIDTLIDNLGGNSDLSSLIEDRIGMLKVSQQFYKVPKVLYLLPVNGKLRIPLNHTQVLSAEADYNNFKSEKSFVLNNFRNQWKINPDLKVKFGLDTLLSLVSNSYMLLNGILVKIDSIKYRGKRDFALVSVRRREAYDTNLAEQGSEPQ